MKVDTESLTENEVWVKPAEFTLTQGLIGFPEARDFELLVNPEEQPFMWIRCKQSPELGFVVIEPAQIVPGYEIELADDDVAALQIGAAEDALILNIVTVRGGDLESATVNLIGPIVLNRTTMVGKQLIVLNNQRYSARHPVLSAVAD